MELIHAHLALAPVPPSGVDPAIPEAISGIVLKLLAKNAEDRYQSAEGLLADLERCREALRGTGTIEPFVPGQHDRRDLFRLHQKLYGREHDIEALTAAFERALAGHRESVLVSGYSGIGKSSLVHEILRPLARQKGYFTSGKFDQYNRDTPYSAVIQAFDGLVRQILTESEARIERWRSAILEALGPNAQVVCDVIPSLSHVIGPQPPVPALGPLEAQNRLNRCFLLFVSVFARGAHPLVLFLDDLQWIDPASLGLLRELLAADSLEALFFCGAYRDNEVSPGHPLVRAIDDLKRAGLLVRDIVLAPLARPHLLQMLSDSLERDDCGPLADAVQKKTGGNPFFVKEFIRSLHDSSVLTFAVGSGWRWDLARIDALAYTDNVVDLMVRTITRLPPEAVEALKLAAAIGSRFELDVLATVSERSPDEVYGRLDPAIGQGLVIAGRDSYHFAHDKVQEGAYAMIPAAERPAFHLKIGRLLAGKLDLYESQNLFDVVGHMSSAGDLVSDPAERLLLAKMSFEAARRAEDSSAFGAALGYLGLGLLRLPADAWTSQYRAPLPVRDEDGPHALALGPARRRPRAPLREPGARHEPSRSHRGAAAQDERAGAQERSVRRACGGALGAAPVRDRPAPVSRRSHGRSPGPGDAGSGPGEDARGPARPAAARGSGDPRHAGRAPGALLSLLVLEPQQPHHYGREAPREHAAPRPVAARDIRLYQLRGLPLRPGRHRPRLPLRPRRR